MKWINAIVEDLLPQFGGIPTFVEDADRLLDIPEVREAFRERGATIADWDGLPASLEPLKSLSLEERPILVAGDGANRHVVESCLVDFRWETINAATLMPKFGSNIVKAIPTAMWDKLLALHSETRASRTQQETALFIGRSLYGVDIEYLRHGEGWLSLLARLSVGNDPIPPLIARALIDVLPPPWPELTRPEALTETANSRAALASILENQPRIYEEATRAERLLLAEARTAYSPKSSKQPLVDFLEAWHKCGLRPQDVLQFGLMYAQSENSENIEAALRQEINTLFTNWLKLNYGLLMCAPNPEVLRLPTLLDMLDLEYSEEKTVLFVVDSLGLAAWHHVLKSWIINGKVKSAETRAAFAVLPTITILSRRAIFEGKLPSRFSSEVHSPRLERTLWTERYKGQGECFHNAEVKGFFDSLAKGTRRICVTDTSWDKRGHSINPLSDSISTAATVWAEKTPLIRMIQEALLSEYRVILTADHGQIECRGQGRPDVGTLAEERSKRVMIFNDESLCARTAEKWTDNFRPMGLPQSMFLLFASDFNSFDFTGADSVSHGGLSLEEALVPVAVIS